MRFILALLIVWACVPTLSAAEPTAPTTNSASRLAAFTNLVTRLPVHDRVWLMGEQLKQLIGDWVNQQGDVGLDLVYFLQEPTKILSDEVKRMETDHQKQINELRAEIQALRGQLQTSGRTNSLPSPVTVPSTNQPGVRPPPRSGGN